MKVNLSRAKNRLPQLIREVESGNSVTICRRGVPVVDLVPSQQCGGQKPKFGTLKGRIKIYDPNWWKSMDEDELNTFL